MILLISQDLMMSSTVSATVRAEGGTFRYVASVDRAIAKLDGEPCELLLVDLQVKDLDWEALEGLLASVPRSIAYAQHVNIEGLRKGRQLSFDEVLTRGQLHGSIGAIIGGLDDLASL